MKNRITEVESIKLEFSKGMPDGLDEQFLKKIPILFERIHELEIALIPFANAYTVNQNVFKNTSHTPPELLNVYLENCKRAFDILNSK